MAALCDSGRLTYIIYLDCGLSQVMTDSECRREDSVANITELRERDVLLYNWTEGPFVRVGLSSLPLYIDLHVSFKGSFKI